MSSTPPPMRKLPVPSRPPGAPPAARIPRIQRGALTSKPAPRILLYAIEGWGKTTLGAYAPEPVILMAPGEDGYLTLLGQGRVPEVGRAEVTSWHETLGLLDYLIQNPNECRSVVLDGLAGFETLCHQKVCDTEYNGDWGERGFAAYGNGYIAAVREWTILLERLDRLRHLGKNILLLAHTEIRTFSNPTGPDFDQYGTNLHKRTWAATKPWPDLILFGSTVTLVSKDKSGGRAKAVGGTSRVLYTSLTDGYHAKNRHGMPSEISMPDDPSKLWETLWSHIEGGES